MVRWESPRMGRIKWEWFIWVWCNWLVWMMGKLWSIRKHGEQALCILTFDHGIARWPDRRCRPPTEPPQRPPKFVTVPHAVQPLTEQVTNVGAIPHAAVTGSTAGTSVKVSGVWLVSGRKYRLSYAKGSPLYGAQCNDKLLSLPLEPSRRKLGLCVFF